MMKRRRPQGSKFISDNVLAGGVSTKSIPFLVEQHGHQRRRLVIKYRRSSFMCRNGASSAAALDTPRTIGNRASQRRSFTRVDRAVCENCSGYRAQSGSQTDLQSFETKPFKNGTAVPPALPSDIAGGPGGALETGSGRGGTPVTAKQTSNRPGRVLSCHTLGP